MPAESDLLAIRAVRAYARDAEAPMDEDAALAEHVAGERARAVREERERLRERLLGETENWGAYHYSEWVRDLIREVCGE